MEAISIPKKEYLRMKKEIEILKDSDFLKKLNTLIDILYEEKYGLVLTDHIEDLTEFVIDQNFEWSEMSEWDNV